MEMNVMTKKMPAMRALRLSESGRRSRVADADPFGEDIVVVAPLLNIRSILSLDPDTYVVSTWSETIYLPRKFVKRAGTRSTLPARPRSALANEHEDQEVRKTPHAHQTARAGDGRRIRRRTRPPGADDAQPRQGARCRGDVALQPRRQQGRPARRDDRAGLQRDPTPE